MDSKVNEHIIALAAAGDGASQRMIYETYHVRACQLAFLLLGDAQDVEEVVQDSFVYALRNLARYDVERASLWTWLRVILVSRCRNKRRRKRLPHISFEQLTADGREPADDHGMGDPARAAQRRDVQRTVVEALEEVSPGARDALILRYYEGLPYAAVAEMLNCTSAAARQRVVHGKRQLRKILSRREAGTWVESGAIRTGRAA